MELYTNDIGKPVYRGVKLDDDFSSNLFHKPKYQPEDDECFAFHSNLGSLTVVDRLTGFGGGVRDTETGYRSEDGDFWLASCNNDVRESGCSTVGEAIDWVKERANTCIPTKTLENKNDSERTD